MATTIIDGENNNFDRAFWIKKAQGDDPILVAFNNLTIQNSKVNAILNNEKLTLINCYLAFNEGSALANSGGYLSVKNSIIENNSTPGTGGGGVYIGGGSVYITNSVINNNHPR